MNDEGLADVEPLTPFVYPDFTQELGLAKGGFTATIVAARRDSSHVPSIDRR